ncbi:MAG: tetratricopeptide repeat protein [Candidatus Omnitrophota bacterium]|nr:MAG: tetratricopeptide repeat protein [Candidatus Omnitrophota bacterium]
MKITQKRKMVFFLFAMALCTLDMSFARDEEDEKFYIAIKAFDDGFYDASVSLLDRFIEEFPKSSKVHTAKLHKAKCYYFKEDYFGALQILNELIQNKSAKRLHDEVYYWLCRLAIKGKDFREALKYANKIIENYSGSQFEWWARYLAAISHLELGENEKALGLFREIVNECDDTELIEGSLSRLLNLYLLTNNYSPVIELGTKYLSDFPQGNLAAKVSFYLGKSLYAQNEYARALHHYQQSLRLNRDPALADAIYQGMGFTLLAQGNSSGAKEKINMVKDEELRLFSQGVYYFKMNGYAQALEEFDDFLERFPESEYLPNVYLNKADSLYEMGRVNDSLSMYTLILDEFKDTPYTDILDKAHYGLAWCYLKSGGFKKAIEEFRNTLKYTENPIVKISSQIQIADAYQEGEKYEQALEIYNEILKNNPNTIYADYIQFQIGLVFLKMDKLENAFLALRNLQKNFPFSKLIPEAQYFLAVGYFSQEDYRQAKNLLEEIIEKYRQGDLLSKAYYLYGKCFFNEENYSKALEIFQTTMKKFKNREIEELVYIDMGNIYLNLSKFEDAKKIWLIFLKKFPQSQYAPAVILYLGGLYEKEENYPEAERYYKKVIKSYKGSLLMPEAILSLGHLYWRQGDLDTAQEYFRKVQKTDTPLSLKAQLYLAKIYGQTGENDAALALYDGLINSSLEASKVALLEKAILLKEMKKYSQAIVFFRKAIEAGIDSPKIRLFLGISLEKSNKLKEAQDEYFNLIYKFNDEEYKVKAYFRMAKIYERKGNVKEAKKIYKKIIDLGVEESKIAKARYKELESR